MGGCGQDTQHTNQCTVTFVVPGPVEPAFQMFRASLSILSFYPKAHVKIQQLQGKSGKTGRQATAQRAANVGKKHLKPFQSCVSFLGMSLTGASDGPTEVGPPQ